MPLCIHIHASFRKTCLLVKLSDFDFYSLHITRDKNNEFFLRLNVLRYHISAITLPRTDTYQDLRELRVLVTWSLPPSLFLSRDRYSHRTSDHVCSI